jgi:hypothetical protein
MRMFAKVMIWVFGLEYHRAPNEKDTKKIDEDEWKERLVGHARECWLYVLEIEEFSKGMA